MEIKMATLTPYIGKSNDRLTALINEDNGSRLEEGVQFTYGPVGSYADDEGRNSKIKLIPVPGTIYKEEAEVYFWRLSIGVLADLPPGTLGEVEIPSYPTTIHAALPKINTAFGLSLTTEEVEDLPIEAPDTNCSLVIRSGSLAWLENSSFVFQTKQSEGVDIGDIILNTVLDGLEWN